MGGGLALPHPPPTVMRVVPLLALVAMACAVASASAASHSLDAGEQRVARSDGRDWVATGAAGDDW